MKISIIAFVLLCLSTSLIAQQDTLIGKKISDFTLKNTDEQWTSLHDYQNAKGFVVVFTCNHCPMAKLYSKRLNDLEEKYGAKGVHVIAINSMDTLVYAEEQFDKMQKKAKKENFDFPYLHDTQQTTAKQFNAQHTPQAFVLWKENNEWVIRYTGAIDDNGQHPELATPYIADAVDDLLQNKAVIMPVTPSFGCRIYFRDENTID